MEKIENILSVFDNPSPSSRKVGRVVEIVRSILFPGFFDAGDEGAYVLLPLLSEQIAVAFRFEGDDDSQAASLAQTFVDYIPELRHRLALDVLAIYDGDPAASSYGEIISCYPAVRAVSNYRMAHRLYELGVPLIPRIITELAHSETGIDIHPGATIGDSFTIDHGTGIVIGETTIIGNHVKLYQGVTLGARSFPLDDKGNPIKGIPRHPILGNGVIVYSNATILGRITIGDGAVIGGNIWVTEDVPAGALITQRR